MIFENSSEQQRHLYGQLIQAVAGLSRLFSDSNTPYLYYRCAEKIYCDAFESRDVSRSDIAVDAISGNTGIGLKTFIQGNGKTYQKVAEFDKMNQDFIGLSPQKIVQKISEARNFRIEVSSVAYGYSEQIYHLLTRGHNICFIFEEEMDPIDLNSITNISKKGNAILFRDRKNEYKFYLSKSTLLKRFVCNASKAISKVPVTILDDPLNGILENSANVLPLGDNMNQQKEEVILPLYVTAPGGGYDYGDVQKKSGLNQAFARGRVRDVNEIYLPVPKVIHWAFPNFFPGTTRTSFQLILPNGKRLSAKMCQSDLKGLMSNPNKDLGKWLLRDVLKITPGELITRSHLNQAGLDCVRITRINSSEYEINFAPLGTYEEFITPHLD
jgi:hypothetical protein